MASTVLGEVDTSDNELSGGLVKVKMTGDINGDEMVDIYDVVEATRAYDSRPGDANWNPDADLAPQFGLINIFDIATLVFHY